jgi:hypothetical protein
MAERVNVVLGIYMYKHYPGSISPLKQYPGYTSLSRTLPSIVIRYLHSRLSRTWLWSRDRPKENGGDGVLFLVTTERSWVMFVYTQDDIYPFWVTMPEYYIVTFQLDSPGLPTVMNKQQLYHAMLTIKDK